LFGTPNAEGRRLLLAHVAFPRDVRMLPYLSGGGVKYLDLVGQLPPYIESANLLFAVSSHYTPMLPLLVRVARKKGVPFIWNQDGAYFPSAYGKKVADKGNARMARLLHAADYVFYQSEFAKIGSDFFLGPREAHSEILYNAVDTTKFKPSGERPAGLVLLAAGSHNDDYRLPLAMQTLASVRRVRSDARLIIAGLVPEKDRRSLRQHLMELGLENAVDWIGAYAPRDAPSIFNRAHVLLHTQYNDVCPTTVIEAMACGLPVVYSKTGGTPELVGEDAGYGIGTLLDWYVPHPPAPEALAEGVCRVADSWSRYSQAARARAVACFDLYPWIERHKLIFDGLRNHAV